MGQAFDDGISWGTAYSLDSASTMWVTPTPSGIMPGDIAVEDEINQGNPISPLVTAFVRHDNTQAASEIHLVLADLNSSLVLSDTFSAPQGLTGCPLTNCRHPVVEVTYSRPQEAMIGTIRVHVIWSQLTGTDPNEHWDLYYRYLQFPVYQGGPVWVPDWDETVRLPFCVPARDEIQPDICVDAQGGDLFVIYNQHETVNPTVRFIMAARHDYSAMLIPSQWDSPYPVAPLNTDEKGASSIDAGILYHPNISPVREGRVAAVWTQRVLDQMWGDMRWQVFYNNWSPSGVANPSSARRITVGGEFARVNCLPKVDITCESSDIHQAVLTWFDCFQSGSEYSDFIVHMAATPFPPPPAIPLIYTIQESGYNRCPDLACYQMSGMSEHWFAVSYYHSATGSEEQPWPVEVRSFSFYVDWQQMVAVISPEWQTSPDGNGLWSPGNPFTGSSLCLRDPSYSDPGGEPIYDVFGLGWVDEGYMAFLSQGVIP